VTRARSGPGVGSAHGRGDRRRGCTPGWRRPTAARPLLSGSCRETGCPAGGRDPRHRQPRSADPGNAADQASGCAHLATAVQVAADQILTLDRRSRRFPSSVPRAMIDGSPSASGR